MFLVESFYEAEIPQEATQEPTAPEEIDTGDGVVPQDVEAQQQLPAEPPEFAPLKKFYLVQKLQDLQTRLMDRNIQENSIDTILQFANQISYPSLVVLCMSLIPQLEEELLRGQKNEL